MKKIIFSFSFIFALGNTFGQSVTLTPNSALNNEVVKLKKSGIGLDQSDNSGVVRVGTYVNSSSAFIQTHSNHALNFSTNNGITQMTLTTTGNFGIGNSTPTEKLEVNGNIRSSNLAGTGTRSVFADANGTLTAAAASPQTYTMSIAPQAFQPRYNNSGTFTGLSSYANCFMSVGSTDDLITGVNLPDGATITSVTLYFIDADATAKFYCMLGQNLLTFGSRGIIYEGITSAISNTNSSVLSYIVPINPTQNLTLVNNTSYSYYILITPVNVSNVGVPWAANMSIKGVKITYTL